MLFVGCARVPPGVVAGRVVDTRYGYHGYAFEVPDGYRLVATTTFDGGALEPRLGNDAPKRLDSGVTATHDHARHLSSRVIRSVDLDYALTFESDATQRLITFAPAEDYDVWPDFHTKNRLDFERWEVQLREAAASWVDFEGAVKWSNLPGVWSYTRRGVYHLSDGDPQQDRVVAVEAILLGRLNDVYYVFGWAQRDTTVPLDDDLAALEADVKAFARTLTWKPD